MVVFLNSRSTWEITLKEEKKELSLKYELYPMSIIILRVVTEKKIILIFNWAYWFFIDKGNFSLEIALIGIWQTASFDSCRQV